MSTNCLQYLFYCIVISMKPNLLLLLDLYVGNSLRDKKYIVKDILVVPYIVTTNDEVCNLMFHILDCDIFCSIMNCI